MHQHLVVDRRLGGLPDEAAGWLREAQVRTFMRNRHQLSELARLLEAFEKWSIPVVVLKGPALACTLYRRPSFRPFVDLDLWIQPEQRAEALAKLQEAGYTSTIQRPWVQRLLHRVHFNQSFKQAGAKPLHLELHWALTDRFNTYTLDEKALWSRVVTWPADKGIAARTLCVEDNLLYLALHLQTHGILNLAIPDAEQAQRFVVREESGNRLIWLTDLLELILKHRESICWPTLMARLKETGAKPAMASSLQLLEWLFPDFKRPEALASLPPPVASGLKRAAFARIGEPPNHLESPPTNSEALGKLLHKSKEADPVLSVRLMRLLDLTEVLFPNREYFERQYGPLRSLSMPFRRVGHAVRQSAELILLGGLMVGGNLIHRSRAAKRAQANANIPSTLPSSS